MGGVRHTLSGMTAVQEPESGPAGAGEQVPPGYACVRGALEDRGFAARGRARGDPADIWK